MENKTFFFRGDKYNALEMIERIPSQEFIRYMGLYTDTILKTKEAAIDFLFSCESEKQNKILTDCFNAYGQKGDILNVRIYSFEKSNLNISDIHNKEILLSLKGKLINELPLLSSFLNCPCTMQDIKINDGCSVDFKFSFEIETYKQQDDKPIKVLENIIVECRYYIEQNVVAMVDSRKTEQKSVLDILSVLPAFIDLQDVKKNSISSVNPNYSDIEIYPSQLEFVKSFLNGKLKGIEQEVKGEKGVFFKLDGTSKNFEDESAFLKVVSSQGDYTLMSFYCTEPNGNKIVITVKNDAQIVSTSYVSEDILDVIVRLVIKTDKYKDFLIPIKKTVGEYCNYLHIGMLTRQKLNHLSDITDDLNTLIEDIFRLYEVNRELTETCLTITFNIIIELSKQTFLIHNNCELKTEDYVNLKKFLYTYLLRKYNIILTDDKLNDVLFNFCDVLKNSGTEDIDIIEYYKEKYI